MKLIAYTFGFGFLLLIVAMSFAYVKFAGVDALLAIHFSPRQGVDFLGSSMDVFGIIFTGFGVLLANGFVAWYLNKREHFLSVIVAFFSVLLALLLFIATFVIIVNN